MKLRTLVLVAAMVVASSAHGQSPSPSAAAAEHVVTEFLSWYVQMWPAERGPHMRALRERPAQFAALLVNALRADSAATAQGGEEIDGLDADPFLSTQDPCTSYRVVRTTKRGADYFVEVLGIGGCLSHTEPDVIVQVAWRERRPVFVNFLYSHERGHDLMSMLRRFAAQRRAAARAPR